MMTQNEMMEKVAKSVGTTVEALSQRTQQIMEEQGAAWQNAGKSEADCQVLAMRVAARQITTEMARLKRSGATMYEGMFISVPRYKDWGKILYNKMSNQLKSLDEDAREALVAQGRVVLFEDNHDGTYTRTANPSLVAKEMFEEGADTSEVSELPRNTMALDENTHFYIVWDKNNPEFPSGDRNFKYGNARPLEERERTSLFLGRAEGGKDWEPITIKASGKAAEENFPTFSTGRIAMRVGKNGVGYLKAGVSQFVTDESLTSMFSEPPVALSDKGATGLMPSYLNDDFLGGLGAIGPFYDEHNGTDGWWDRVVGLCAEVIHIDPRENGGYTLICGDLDITADASTLDVYVPASQEDRVDFAIGTKVLLVGGVWKTQEGEYRMSVNGWWPFDAIEPMAEVGGDDGDDGGDA